MRTETGAREENFRVVWRGRESNGVWVHRGMWAVDNNVREICIHRQKLVADSNLSIRV